MIHNCHNTLLHSKYIAACWRISTIVSKVFLDHVAHYKGTSLSRRWRCRNVQLRAQYEKNVDPVT